jgi:hypothetical protein
VPKHVAILRDIITSIKFSVAIAGICLKDCYITTNFVVLTGIIYAGFGVFTAMVVVKLYFMCYMVVFGLESREYGISDPSR